MASNCFNYPKLNGAEGGVGGAAPGRASIVLQHLQQHQVRKDERAGSRLDGWLGHQPRPPPPCRVGNGLILHILQMERGGGEGVREEVVSTARVTQDNKLINGPRTWTTKMRRWRVRCSSSTPLLLF